MSDSSPLELACPNCKAKVLWNEEFPERPFCSARCKLMDFGEWANEGNKIAGNSIYDDVLSDDLNEEY
jgi:endogenous inhibitor of DNA gyrase (YacG/DUF329 family)